jgi:acetamidase/formamidase
VISPHLPPVGRLVPGELITLKTVDCFNGQLTSESQVPSAVLSQSLNPLTGPFWIMGAEPGDTLAVTLVDIRPTRDWAVSCLLPDCGGLIGIPTLAPGLPEQVYIYHRTPSGGYAWRDRWEIPWKPFYGTIGTAPAREAISSSTPGPHGGNMDVPDVTIGNTLFLPVRVPGALFYVGDAHAAQGQGELAGPAIEIETEGVFRFELIKNRALAWPRIETEDAIMSIGSARPMEDAARIAYHDLVSWLADDYGFERLEAYQLLTQVGGLYVANMVNPAYSLVASCPKRYLPAPEQSPALIPFPTPVSQSTAS